MRTLFVLIVGIVLGALGYYVYETQPQFVGHASPPPSKSARDTANDMVARGRSFASDASDRFAQKLREWHLTGPDIHADLQKTGEVARQNTARIRERVSDARIVAVIKAKIVLDRDLSVNSIQVESRDGNVTLTGTVTAEDLIGRAVGDALDTDGVQHVTSRLKVETSEVPRNR